MTNQKLQILFLGCGKMGSAILENFLDKNINPQNITIVDPFIKNKIKDINYFSDINKIPQNYQVDLVIFAFKPQSATEILSNFIKNIIFTQNTIFISILAGKKISFFTDYLGKNIKIIRIMPNLPMAIGEGISAYVTSKNLSRCEIDSTMNLWSKNLQLEEGQKIDIFTAIAGSGPAYLFLFAKELINIAKKNSFDEESSRKMVTQMLYGSAKMLLDDNLNISELINSVTSKGGTTEAGLKEFANGDFSSLIEKVINAAKDRSEELGK